MNKQLNGLPIVILVRPQMGENIGAVARAMSNFGLKELRIAEPRDGWPNPKALEMAAGAESIIQNAVVYENFQAAMADVQLAFATTARPRNTDKRVMEPAAAMAEIRAHCDAGLNVALVFGPERSGLANDDITLCDTLVSIPTAPENSSLNIAQSAVLIGYEWFRASGDAPQLSREAPDPAPMEDWHGLFVQMEGYLDAVDYFRVEARKPVMWTNLQHMLLRARWNPQQVRTFRGMLRSVWERGANKG